MDVYRVGHSVGAEFVENKGKGQKWALDEAFREHEFDDLLERM